MTPEIPPTTPKCSALTKAGEACKGWAVDGGSTCVAHTPGLKERSLAAATKASAEARSNAVAERKQASKQAKRSLTEVIRSQAAMKRTEIAKALVEAAVADGSSRAMAELLNRVEGKVTDSLNLNAGDPFTMDEASLHRWLSEGSEGPKEPGTAPTESL